MTKISSFRESKVSLAIHQMYDNCTIQARNLLKEHGLDIKATITQENCSDINDACIGGYMYDHRADKIYKIQIESDEVSGDLVYYPTEKESLYLSLHVITISEEAYMDFRLIYVPVKLRNKGFMTSVMKQMKDFLKDIGSDMIINCGDASDGQTTHVADKLGLELDNNLLKRLQVVTDRYA